MKTATILVAVMAAMLGAATLTSAPAEAQEGESQSASAGATGYPAGGEPPPPFPDYAFRDGEVYVSGDLVVGCREFAERFDEGYDEWGNQAQAERVLKRCEQAGLPALRIPAEVRGEVRQDTRSGTLPETGGISPPLLTAGLLLAGAGLLALGKTG